MLLDAEQVAEMLGVTPHTVRRLSRAGLIQRVELGARLVRFTPESIEALIAPTKDHDRAQNAAAGKAGNDDAHHQV